MKSTIISFAVLAGIFGNIALFSQDYNAQRWNNNHQNFRQRQWQRPNREMSKDVSKKWASLQSELKKKYPAKYAKIEALAKTNLAKAAQELTALARTAKMEIPRERRSFNRGSQHFGAMRWQHRGGQSAGMGSNFSFRNPRAAAEEQIKTKFPAEYAKIEKQREEIETNLQSLAKKGNITLPDTAETLQKKMRLVREKYKTEFDEIAKLRQSDPSAAWERTQEIYKREGITFPRFGSNRHQMGQNNTPRMQEPPAPPRRGNPMMERMKLLRQKYPQEMKKIESLRRSDPASYRRELRALSRKLDQETQAKK